MTRKIIEFVSYDGEYPNLCSGKLVLRVDGEERKFERWDEKFWRSGGEVTFSSDWEANVTSGPWEIDIQKLPKDLRPYWRIIKKLLNENIPYGCCGGCV